MGIECPSCYLHLGNKVEGLEMSFQVLEWGTQTLKDRAAPLQSLPSPQPHLSK